MGNGATGGAASGAAAGAPGAPGAPGESIELQKRHLTAVSWICSAQKGHAFMSGRAYTDSKKLSAQQAEMIETLGGRVSKP